MNRKNIIIVAFIINLVVIILHFLFHPVRVLDMPTSIFYLDEEITIASFVTFITAFLVGYVHIETAMQIKDKVNQKLTIVVGILFVLFSIDEYFELHEYTNTLVKGLLGNEGLIGQLANLSWIFSLFFVIIGAFSIFLWTIKKEENRYSRTAYMVGSALFVVVLLLEVFGAANYGKNIYLVSVGIEEGGEMLAMTAFLMAAYNKNRN